MQTIGYRHQKLCKKQTQSSSFPLEVYNRHQLLYLDSLNKKKNSSCYSQSFQKAKQLLSLGVATYDATLF